MGRKRLFCELGPTAYAISKKRLILKRRLKNLFSNDKFAKTFQLDKKLPELISTHSSNMIKRGPGIDPTLQYNKADNIRLACSKINGLIVNPGETFSFWFLVGETSKKNGFRDGRILRNGKLVAGSGGGLCNLANTLHLVIMHSPMTITELHHHSDALAPDENGVRVPYWAGTSVNYNYIDLRFRNDTDQTVQIIAECNGDDLIAEFRASKPFNQTFRIVEEDHHFSKENNGKYYRKSKIYREIIDKNTGEIVGKELKWDNRSEVMYDYKLIPKNLIK